MPPNPDLESRPLNHTQIIVEHTGILATLTEQNSHIIKKLQEIETQNVRQYELMNRYDIKQDELIKAVSVLNADTAKLKTERNALVWFIGLVASGVGALIMKFWDTIKI